MRTLCRLLVPALAAASIAPGGAIESDAPGEGPEHYYIVFLRPDPGRKPLAKEERERIQAAHMANIQKMADDGILVAAGPMEDQPVTISGIFVFKMDSLAEARRIASLDPTVVERRNTVDVHSWWGPKGIGTGYFQLKREHPEAKVAMAAHVLCIVKRGATPAGDTLAAGDSSRLIESLRGAGALAAAGPIDGDPDLAAVLVFKSDSAEAAQKSIARDPAVQSGRLAAEFHRWWCADLVLPW
jgi:uncharacterized protein YciI